MITTEFLGDFVGVVVGVRLITDFGGAFSEDDLILLKIFAIPPSAPMCLGGGADCTDWGLEMNDGI